MLYAVLNPASNVHPLPHRGRGRVCGDVVGGGV